MLQMITIGGPQGEEEEREGAGEKERETVTY